MRLRVRNCELRDANAFVQRLHRHHKRAAGHRFSLRAVDSTGETRGVCIVGRPVARAIDHSRVVEVTRLCTDGTPNACSVLYSAAARAARELGYAEIQTYVLATEPGTSLVASGWERGNDVKGRSWSCQSRPRTDKHPTVDKVRWFKRLSAAERNAT